MSKYDHNLTDEEKLFREKARQALKKSKTPTYAPDDEDGLMTGPLTTEEMKNQAEEDDA